MDNVQKVNNCINIPFLQTFYILFMYLSLIMWKFVCQNYLHMEIILPEGKYKHIHYTYLMHDICFV
jgi:hypothetical protein